MPMHTKPHSFEISTKCGHLDCTLFINDNFFSIPTDEVSTPHNHHDFEFFYVSSGRLNMAIEGRAISASAGDIVLIHPLEYHCRTQCSVNTASSFFNFRVAIKAPLDKDEQPIPHHAHKHIETALLQYRFLRGNTAMLATYLSQLHREISEKSSGYLGNVQSLCQLILTELVRLSGDIPEWFFPTEELKFRGHDRDVIDGFFVDKYLTNVKIQDLAYDMKVSVRQVNRIMHRMFGMSFTQKLTEMRLWEVARQLMNTQKPITTISQNCGFNNYNYFYVCFRKKFNMTPTEFRAQKRIEK